MLKRVKSIEYKYNELAQKYPKRVSFLLGAILGCILFLFLYGGKVLNVTYDAWTDFDGDLTQHYVGWMAYRNAEWKFPFCVTNNLSFPEYVSVLYTDSIPLFAVIFKFLSPILPKTFQYFGIFGILSFSMMGGVSSLLLYSFIEKISVSAILSSLFIYSPYVLQRMFIHTALGGQWIIIAGIYLWLCRPVKKVSKNALVWFALAFIATCTHVYFIPMIGVLSCCSAIDKLVNDKKFQNVTIPLATLLGGFISALIFGGFYNLPNVVNANFGKNGLKTYSPVFLATGNTIWNTSVLKADDYGERAVFFGLGILIPTIIVLIFYFCIKKSYQKIWDKGQIISVICGLAVLLFLYQGPDIYPFTLPEPILKVWGLFRNTGRFMWPIVYIIMTIVLINFFKNLNGNKYRIVVISLVICAIQYMYSAPLLQKIHDKEAYREYVDFNKSLDLAPLDYLLENNRTTVIFQPYSRYHSYGVEIVRDAIKHGGKASNFYFARDDEYMRQSFNKTVQQELLNGMVREDAIYLFTPSSADLYKYPLYLYKWDAIEGVIGVSSEMPLLESEYGLTRYFPDDTTDVSLFLYSIDNNGENDNLYYDRPIPSEKTAKGPGICMSKGKYVISIYGQNMIYTGVAIYNDEIASENEGEGAYYNAAETYRDDSRVDYIVDIDEDTVKLSIDITNHDNERTMLLGGVSIREASDIE